MLNLFPIQFLSPLAYFLLRVCVGFVFLRFGYLHLKEYKQNNSPLLLSLFGILEILLGIEFIIGFFTQFAALIGILFSFSYLIFLRLRTPKETPRLLFVLLIMMNLSLFITGAGAFAFDLPL